MNRDIHLPISLISLTFSLLGDIHSPISLISLTFILLANEEEWSHSIEYALCQNNEYHTIEVLFPLKFGVIKFVLKLDIYFIALRMVIPCIIKTFKDMSSEI